MQRISYSDGRTVEARLAIWDDWHEERSGFYRAYWENSEGTAGSPVFGLTQNWHSWRTIQAAALDALKVYPGEPVYRNGRQIRIRR